MENGIMPVSLSSLGAKTMRRLTLTSGTSWTVPAGVTFVNVTLVGGGGGGGGAQYSPSSDQNWYGNGADGLGGQIISSTLSCTPADTIAYAIGAGGNGGQGQGSVGGTTTFTGATSALGGNRGMGTNQGDGSVGRQGLTAANYGGAGRGHNGWSGGAGGAGAIYIEYWV
jgi:hypothetical protein